mmetsp:Transcript_27467/g.38651  ORF Transcript_27467/g.38651 Transcript_27467/m.38651 type:complete len:546 (-) Transcript_27467:107-1744(-)
MAAPDKSSPSNQSIQKTTVDVELTAKNAPSVALKDPPQVAIESSSPSVAAAAADSPSETAASTSTSVVVPTYESSESSDAYVKGKQLLAAGAFEDALETVAEAISVVMSMLSVENQETHESLAPLQYLYGTTLLYSVEETDSSADPMVQQQQEQADNEEQADDLQIAWENLESARHIVSELVVASTTTSNDAQKLKLDLAQIHLRLGDLQRTNGRYMDAISDYTSCLELRKPILSEYDRKVADAYYMLGLVSNMLASEGDKQLDEQKQQDNPTAAAATDGGPEQPPLSPALIEEYRTKSIENFLLCSKSIAGIISTLCGADPKEIIGNSDDDLDGPGDEKVTSTPVAAAGGGKTTGLELSDLLLTNASRTLSAIRNRIAEKFFHTKQASSTSTNDNDETVKELAEMLDEIQETIDEAENTKKGLHDVAEIKANAQAAIEKSDAADAAAVGGSEATAANPWAAFSNSGGKAAAAAATTTTSDGKEGTTTIGFGSVSSTATTATAAPTMMLVKKKKKRDATSMDDSKPAAAATTLVPKKKVKEAPTE